MENGGENVVDKGCVFEEERYEVVVYVWFFEERVVFGEFGGLILNDLVGFGIVFGEMEGGCGED